MVKEMAILQREAEAKIQRRMAASQKGEDFKTMAGQAKLIEQYGKAVAREGAVNAYKGAEHGATQSLNNKAASKVDLILFRGKESPKEFGTIKSYVEAPQRGQGGPAVITSRSEKMRYRLWTPEGEGNFNSVREAMRKAEFYRGLRNTRLKGKNKI